MVEQLKENSYQKNQKVIYVNLEGKKSEEIEYDYLFSEIRNKGNDLIYLKDLNGLPLLKEVNIGKMLYEEKKNKKKQRQNIQDSKEIRFGLNIGKHDFNIKINHIKEFLENNVKVKVTVQLNGREINHPEFAIDLMDNIISELNGYGITEDKKVLNGRFLSMNFTKVKEKKND